MVKPVVFQSSEAASQYVADLMIEQIREKPNSLICLASGGSPTRAYELFVEGCRGTSSTSTPFSPPAYAELMRLIKLDEWGGLALDDPASCEHHLQKTIIEPLSAQDRYVAFHGNNQDHEAECQRIAKELLEQGPIDLCVLGLGVNGHLGFNEPADHLQPHAHVARLSQASLEHAMLDTVRTRPTCGLTLGMADLLQSGTIILIVTGTSKREAMRSLLTGRIQTQFPASFLNLHPRMHLVCDDAALGPH